MDTLDSTSSLDNRVFETKSSMDAQYNEVAFPSLVSRVKALFIDLIIILIVFRPQHYSLTALAKFPTLREGLS